MSPGRGRLRDSRFWIGTAAIGALLLCARPGAAADNILSRVRFESDGTWFRMSVLSRARWAHWTLGNPPRIILDLHDCVSRLPNAPGLFEIYLNRGPIKVFRTSQFDNRESSRRVRITLELTRVTEYEARRVGDQIQILVEDPTPHQPQVCGVTAHGYVESDPFLLPDLERGGTGSSGDRRDSGSAGISSADSRRGSARVSSRSPAGPAGRNPGLSASARPETARESDTKRSPSSMDESEPHLVTAVREIESLMKHKGFGRQQVSPGDGSAPAPGSDSRADSGPAVESPSSSRPGGGSDLAADSGGMTASRTFPGSPKSNGARKDEAREPDETRKAADSRKTEGAPETAAAGKLDDAMTAAGPDERSDRSPHSADRSGAGTASVATRSAGSRTLSTDGAEEPDDAEEPDEAQEPDGAQEPDAAREAGDADGDPPFDGIEDPGMIPPPDPSFAAAQSEDHRKSPAEKGAGTALGAPTANPAESGPAPAGPGPDAASVRDQAARRLVAQAAQLWVDGDTETACATADRAFRHYGAEPAGGQAGLLLREMRRATGQPGPDHPMENLPSAPDPEVIPTSAFVHLLQTFIDAGNDQEATRLAGAWGPSYPPETWSSRLQLALGEHSYAVRQVGEAIRHLERIPPGDSLESRSLLLRARLRDEAGDAAAALELYRKLAKLGSGPYQVRGMARTADLEFQMNRVEQARDAYQALLDAGAGEEEAWALYQLANCHLLLGDTARARSLYQDLVQRLPDAFWTPFARERLESLGWREDLVKKIEEMSQP